MTMMEETLLTGTAHKAELPGWQAAGKTGTSQDWRDAWFVGYTSYLVAGVWLGNDDGAPTKKVSGGNLPVEIWSRFMKARPSGRAGRRFALRRLAQRRCAAGARRAPPPAPVGTPLAIGRGGAGSSPQPDSNGLTPPTDVPSADGRLPGAPPPRDAGLLGKLFGSM